MAFGWRNVVLALLVVGLLAFPAITGWSAAPTPSTGASLEETRIVEDLLSLEQSIELGLYLLKTALISPSPIDASVNLPELITLLVGTETYPSRAGAIARIADILDSISALDLSGPAQAELRFAVETAAGFLNQALGQATEARSLLEEGEDATQVLQATYASVAAALGEEGSANHLGGLREAIRLLRDRTVVVAIGESLADAVERILPGGTVYLEPGLHLLPNALNIGKDLTIARKPGSTEQVVLEFTPDYGTMGITVYSSTGPITVQIENVEITGANRAIASGANVTLRLRNVSLRGNTMGIHVSDSSLDLVGCVITENTDYGILITRMQPSTLVRCSIVKNGTKASAGEPYWFVGGIRTELSAVIELRDCDVSGNMGYGILAQGVTDLSIHNSRISDNQTEGILLLDRGSLEIYDSVVQRNGTIGLLAHSDTCPRYEDMFVSHHYRGEIRGSGNVIPGPDDPDGNGMAGVCPAGYRSLIGP